MKISSKNSKQHLSALSLMGLLTSAALMTPAGTFAQTVTTSASNTNTQSGSYNDSTTTVNDSVTVNNTNSASICNVVTQDATTGGNTVSSVNGNVNLSTGSASTTSDIKTNVNNNTTTVAAGSGTTDVHTSNTNTGVDSQNFAYGTVNGSTTVNNSNNLDAHNMVNQTASTGKNEVESVNGKVDLSTGNATLKSNVETKGNTNTTTVSGGMGGVKLSADNMNTQTDSYNDANATANLNTTVNNDNSASVSNDVHQKGVTGKNEFENINGNVDAGHTTGSVDMSSSVMNEVNSNKTDISGVGSVSLTASNKNTQEDSQNYANATANVNATVNNSNDLSVSNDVHQYGISGKNEFDHINGNVGLSTGDVKGSSVLSTKGNVNKTSIGGVGGYGMYGSYGGGFTASAMNENTQTDSYNDANSTLNLNLTANNSNSARVMNMSHMYGNSGFNEAENINGNVGFRTGSTTMDGKISNDLNYNTTTMGASGAMTENTKNLNTQTDSQNFAYATINKNKTVDNSNALSLFNNFKVKSGSGKNEFEYVNGHVSLNGGSGRSSMTISDMGNFSTSNL